MMIQTADRCNKKSSSFTNTRALSTKDNLTPQGIRKMHSTEVALPLKRLLDHNLPVQVVTKLFKIKTPGFWTTTLPALQMLIILFTNPAAY